MSRKKMLSRSERLKWFNHARFGMFIHWGLNSLPHRAPEPSGGVLGQRLLDADAYAPVAGRFRPTKFDPDAWVALAKEAGMKYIVLTTRGHNGFCIFDSKVSDFTSVKTAAGRDFVADFVRACRRGGMKIGFYYSLLDWRFPGYFKGPEKDPEGWQECVRYAHAQVRELCTQYGKIDILWYDGGWVPWATDVAEWWHVSPSDVWRVRALNREVRRLQPHILINKRGGPVGDFDTPEQHITASAPGRSWESCMTMNDNWYYRAQDRNWKSRTELIHNLATCAAGGGNYLLDVGPRPDGAIPAAAVKRLKEIGAWMKANGEAIHGAARTGFDPQHVGVASARGNVVYLHVFNWPGEQICLPGVSPRVSSAHFLATGRKTGVAQDRDRLILYDLPGKAPDESDTVIALKTEVRSLRRVR